MRLAPVQTADGKLLTYTATRYTCFDLGAELTIPMTLDRMLVVLDLGFWSVISASSCTSQHR